MGLFAIVAYRPRPGMEAVLLQLTREHAPILRAQGLVTQRPPYAMHAKDGTIVEVFEWMSAEAIAQAHTNSAVQALWARYNEACTYEPLGNLEECKQMFACFKPIELQS
jgi:hypothetical protein